MNGKKVKCGNIQVGIGDEIRVGGLVGALPKPAPPVPTITTRTLKRRTRTGAPSLKDQAEGQIERIEQIVRSEHKYTTPPRRSKDKTHPDGEPESGPFSHTKNPRMKRSTEASHMIHRNMHPIGRIPLSLSPTKAAEEASDRIPTSVEEHIKPILDSIGHNQSIYTLWPAVSLPQVSPWGPAVKHNLIKFSLKPRAVPK